MLKTAGFVQVESIGQLEGQTFCQDPHCGDVLVFPAQLRAQLYSTQLLSNHKLIIQVRAAQREELPKKEQPPPGGLNLVSEICVAPSISDIHNFTLAIDLPKLIMRLRSHMPTKISLPGNEYFTLLPLIRPYFILSYKDFFSLGGGEQFNHLISTPLKSSCRTNCKQNTAPQHN